MDNIKPNDTVLHIPSGETWVVCGVNHTTQTIIPCGYPFPSVAKIKDCIVINKSSEPQNQEQKNALQKYGYETYIER